MLKTKKDIDKHVADILGRLKSEQERNLRGYNFAKHYYNVKEYEAARRHLSGFLSLKETPPAHKLMGQIYEQFGQLEKAVQSYKRSLELDGHQKDVVLKLCELYCQIPVDPDRARYWADRAEKLFPHSEVVFRLRESLVNVDGDQNTQELEDLITNELIVRPRDVNLWVKLLKLYLDTERVKEAYDHAVQVEEKRPHYDSIDWYYCLSDVFEAYLEEQGHRYDQAVCIQILNALNRLVYLNIIDNHEANKENCNSSSQSRSMASSTTLYSFDLHLFQAIKLPVAKSNLWSAFLDHMRGQLYLHMAMIILKRLKLDHGSQKEASRFGAALLLAAYSFKAPNITKLLHEVKDNEILLYQMLYSQACYRLSQSGHVIMSMCREDKSKWLGKIREQVSTPQIKDKIYQRVFNSKSQKLDTSVSHFMHSNLLSDMSEEFPEVKSLSDYDIVAITLHPGNLHQIVWISLQNYSPKTKSPPMYGMHVFKGLQYSPAKLENPFPESLCLLDVEAFLYATVRCSAVANEEAHSFTYASSDTPSFLPANICKPLCTEEQSEWWSAAYKMFTNSCSPEKVGEARRRLQHGIEVIRAIGNHGMDISLIVYLARIFTEKATQLKSKSGDGISHANEIKHLETRAELYWKAAIGLLEKLLKNVTIRCPKDCLFSSCERSPSFDEASNYLEEGRFFLARQAMNAGRLEEAISGFENSSSPYASYYQALAYKQLAADEFGSKPRESITSEMRSRYVILLTQARQGFYRTMDRIVNDQKHPLNQTLHEEIEYIETRLARIDPDTAVRPDCIASEESYTQESEEQDPDSPTHSYPANMFADLKGLSENSPRPLLNVISAPVVQPRKQDGGTRRQLEHVRPSPERLDAQIRSLANWHDTVIQTIVEQNKSLMETNRAIVEELKQNKSVVEQLTLQLVELNKKIPMLAKHPKPSKPARPAPQVNTSAANRQLHFEDHEDEGEEEDYYDGYYYHEDDSEGEASNPEKLDIHENPAYTYPDQSISNDYRYGQNSGFPGTSNFVYPSPQPGYSYFPPAHGLAGHPSQLGSNVGGNLVHGQAAQSLAAMAPPPYYGSGPPSMFTGLPFSEGQKLPEFHFNVDSQIGNSAPSGSTVVGKTINVAPTNNVISDVTDSKFKFLPMKPNETGLGSIIQPAQNFESPLNDLTVQSSAFMPTVTAPHAFQIPLPQNMFNQKEPSTPKDLNSENATPVVKEVDSKPVDLSISKGRNISRTESESYNEEDSLGLDFKPIIPLPAEIEVKTGEEDEKILFDDRAKLYRFVSKEWKERGIGIVKILHNDRTGKVRLLMRRDQIFKICANHYIISDMTLKPMKNNEQTWIWAAQDFSEGQVVSEQFCIKFKTADIGRQFKETFDRAKEISKKSEILSQESVPKDVDKGKTVEVSGFGDKFKPKPGSWTCTDCYVNNAANATSCVACGKLNPAASTKTPETVSTVNVPAQTFKFGFPAGAATTGSNNVSAGSQPTTVSTSTFKPSDGVFKFGISPITPVSPISSSEVSSSNEVSSTGFVFGKSPQTKTSGFIFGASNLKSDADDFSQGENDAGTENNAAELGKTRFAFGEFSFTSSPVVSKTSDAKPPVSGKPVDIAKSNLDDQSLNEAEKNKAEIDKSKFVFGGFSFTSSPIVTKETDTKPVKVIAATKKVETGRPNPFSGFSFSPSSPSTTETPSSNIIEDDQKKGTLTEAVWGSLSHHNVVSFGEIAQEGAKTDAFKKDSSFTGFKGTGTVVFSPSPSHNKSASEEFESTAQFKPVIALPELVTVVTGEEDEEKLFGERAKLFRFVTATKEWKERGIGELKIMRRKATGRVRILMRREQVLKICANHYITENMKLQPMLSSEVAWIWVANDFTEGELREEKFAAKFKTVELANSFRNVFEKAQQSLNQISAVKDETVATEPPKVKPLSELFKPKPGSWKCDTCEVRNDEGASKCVACGTPSKLVDKPCGGFDLSEMFKPEEGSWKCSVCLLQNKPVASSCVACQSVKPGTKTVESNSTNASVSPGWKFGFQQQSTPKKAEDLVTVTPKLTDAGPTTSSATGFQFTMKSPVFQFGSSNSPSKVEFQFGISQPFNFSFGGIRPKSPLKTPKSPVEESATEGEAEDETTLDSEGDSIYFHPLIPLPDKVDTRTGEEDEDVLYSQLAKLFRWADGEWKERGVGDFKILRHQTSKKIRLFMRRKPILKVCCNHYLTPEITFQPKDDRSWMWGAKDFADQELKMETLVLRFKTPEISQTFKVAVEDAIKQIVNSEFPSVDTKPLNESFKSFSFKPVEPKTPPSTFSFKSRFGETPPSVESIFVESNSIKVTEPAVEEPSTKQNDASSSRISISEVEVVEEKLPDDSLRTRAQSLMLPPNFYNYEQSPQCPGCRGCYSSDEESETVEDITIVYERKPTEEQIKKAKALLLPPSFYLYEYLPDCPGCRGCDDYIPKIGPEEKKTESNIQEKPKAKLVKTPDEENLPFTGVSSNGFSFAELSRQETSFLKPGAIDPNFKFAGTGAKLFSSAQDDEARDEGGDESEDVTPHDPQFQPVIPLPELVTVVTGEEDEDKLFGERCKLYRFDPVSKQWKERGTGEMKILKHRTTAKCRLIMRREQIHKLVCNQIITPNVEMKPFPTSETAWCWVGNDFSQERQELQHFAVRFKTQTIAEAFRSTYIKCQDNSFNAAG